MYSVIVKSTQLFVNPEFIKQSRFFDNSCQVGTYEVSPFTDGTDLTIMAQVNLATNGDAPGLLRSSRSFAPTSGIRFCTAIGGQPFRPGSVGELQKIKDFYNENYSGILMKYHTKFHASFQSTQGYKL